MALDVDRIRRALIGARGVDPELRRHGAISHRYVVEPVKRGFAEWYQRWAFDL